MHLGWKEKGKKVIILKSKANKKDNVKHKRQI